MDIREFFNLPVEERDELFRVHEKQKSIRARAEYIKKERHSLDKQEAAMQEECEHTFAVTRSKVIEDEYGSRTGVTERTNYCPDCDLRWVTWEA